MVGFLFFRIFIIYKKYMNKFEEKLQSGYEEYLKLPKGTRNSRIDDIYSNHWYIMTGRSIISPHPHRHYTFIEFAYWCGKDETLYKRFINI